MYALLAWIRNLNRKVPATRAHGPRWQLVERTTNDGPRAPRPQPRPARLGLRKELAGEQHTVQPQPMGGSRPGLGARKLIPIGESSRDGLLAELAETNLHERPHTVSHHLVQEAIPAHTKLVLALPALPKP